MPHPSPETFARPQIWPGLTLVGPTTGAGSQIAAQPHGLEAWWDYDYLDTGTGFVFNDHRAQTPFESANYSYGFFVREVSGLDDADIRDSREVRPGRHGEDSYTAMYGGRTLTFTGELRAPNLRMLRELFMDMRTAFSGLEDHKLIFRSGDVTTEVFITCRKSSGLSSREVQDRNYWKRDILLTLRANDPWFLSMTEHNESSEPTGALFLGRIYDRTYPLSYTHYVDPSGYVSDVATTFNFTNNGNFEAYPIITLTGPLQQPIILNRTTGQAITLNTVILDGESAVIDANKRTIVNQNGQTLFWALSPASEWIAIQPGLNELTISVAYVETGGNIAIAFRDAWI